TERYSEFSLYVSGRQSRGLIAMTQDEVDAIETGMATELFASSPCESDLPGNVAETAQPDELMGSKRTAGDTRLQVGRCNLRQRCYRKFLPQLPNLIERNAGNAPTRAQRTADNQDTWLARACIHPLNRPMLCTEPRLHVVR